jgi:quaternary ammonium compound-resistance protein SugE
MNPWALLLAAATFEVIWASGLKSTAGFTRLGPSLTVGAAMIASMWLLALAARTLPIGSTYAVWTGIGTVGTVLFGILWLREPVTAMRLTCIAMIILGVVGLKFFAK